MMRIGFLFIAEAYQCYHGFAIALRLAARDDTRIITYYNDPETPAQLERIRLAYGVPPMEVRRLRRSLLTRVMQSIRILGMFKGLVLRDNRAELDGHDALVVVEDTMAMAPRLGIRHPWLIYSPHGAGDRKIGFLARVRIFDFVLLSGPKTAERMLAAGLIRPDRHALTGSVKLETVGRLRAAAAPLFAAPRPIVLYNAHKVRGLSSWSRFIDPMLAAFADQAEFNLVVAPHVKLFRRRSARLRRRWNTRSAGPILVDTDSERLLDMTYTNAASIYVGDVSSQVYEFLAVPRPCVFLNAHRLDWRDDPNFAHWHLGDVIEHPADLWNTIRAAPVRHEIYRARQEAWSRASLGACWDGSSARAADAIMAFLASAGRRTFV